jgi:hypothetical protein
MASLAKGIYTAIGQDWNFQPANQKVLNEHLIHIGTIMREIKDRGEIPLDEFETLHEEILRSEKQFNAKLRITQSIAAGWDFSSWQPLQGV